MTAMIGVDALQGAIGMREAIDLLERTMVHEEAGRTSVSPKFITEFENGVMRVLFAADGEAGYCAMKAYHNVKNVGTRYVVMLYDMDDGELLAITVVAVESAEAAVRGKQVVATASNARGTEPILRREWLDRCRLLCAVGN